MPRWSASLRSPVFHLPLLMNCTTPTRQPRAHPRPITPKAADDLPLPYPVLTSTIDSGGGTPERTAAPGDRNCYGLRAGAGVAPALRRAAETAARPARKRAT